MPIELISSKLPRDKPHYFFWLGVWWRIAYSGAYARELRSTPWDRERYKSEKIN